MDWKHWTVRLGLSLGIVGGLSETELHAQFTGDYQTNIITTASNWPGDYYVGNNHIGDVLEILPGGVLSNATGALGLLAGADNNMAIVNGGIWSNAFDLIVGNQGAGNGLIVTSGGTVVNEYGYLGFLSPSSNNLAVVADGGVWSNRANVVVGYFGAGNQLMVTTSGAVFNGTGSLGSSSSSSNNVVFVSGIGSVWSNQGNLFLGVSGASNSLVISNQGAVFNSAGGVVGYNSSSSNNNVLVTGNGSVWNNQTTLYIGYSGSGNSLVVSNQGGVFTRFESYVGFDPSSSNNSVLVTGNGTKWESRGDLYVGRAGDNNALNISMGGSVVASNAYVGFFSLADGNQLNVVGGGLSVTNALGTGVLDVRRGALSVGSGMVVADRLLATNSANSVVAFNGGTLSTKGTTIANGSVFVVGDGVSTATLSLEDGTHTFFDGLQISSNATLMGTGTIVGDLFTPGTLAPGHSPGLMSVDGNLTMSNTTVFDLELGGLVQGTSYDFVHVTSNAILDGTLVVSFVDGFESIVTGSDVFTNLLADASLSGAFANVLSGNRLDTADGYGSFLVTYDDGNNLILSDYLVSPIPEPSTMVLLALGGLVLRRRRKR